MSENPGKTTPTPTPTLNQVEAYAKEIEEWLDEALGALGAGDVFAIKRKGENIQKLFIVLHARARRMARLEEALERLKRDYEDELGAHFEERIEAALLECPDCWDMGLEYEGDEWTRCHCQGDGDVEEIEL